MFYVFTDILCKHKKITVLSRIISNVTIYMKFLPWSFTTISIISRLFVTDLALSPTSWGGGNRQQSKFYCRTIWKFVAKVQSRFFHILGIILPLLFSWLNFSASFHTSLEVTKMWIKKKRVTSWFNEAILSKVIFSYSHFLQDSLKDAVVVWQN